jgi:hypothetical protein
MVNVRILSRVSALILIQPNRKSATMNELPVKNRYPDIIYLKLSVQPSERKKALFEDAFLQGQMDSVDLKLTLRFGTLTLCSRIGSVCVGLKRGVLSLTFKNARIPLEKMGLVSSFSIAVEVEQQQSTSREHEGTVAALPGLKAKETSQQTEKVKYLVSNIRNGGTEVEPTWTFETNSTESHYLLGQITDALLGNVEINSKPAVLNAEFISISQRDLHLVGEGLWPKDLSRNKLAVIERAFFRKFIEPRLNPYLSQVEAQI